MRRAVVAGIFAATHLSCNALLGQYTVLENGPEPCTTETEKEDCPDDHECDADYSGDGVCRLTCSDTNPCPKWRVCTGNFCSEEVGTPCIDAFSDCGSGGDCVITAQDGSDESRPYCSISCVAEELDSCPPSYSCVESLCRDLD